MNHIKNFVSEATEGNIFSTKTSRNKVYGRYESISKQLNDGCVMLEKAIDLINNIIKVIDGPPTSSLVAQVREFIKRSVDLDYERGTVAELNFQSMSYVNQRFHNILNRKDMQDKKIKEIYNNLKQDISKDGIYVRKLSLYTDRFEDINNTLIKLSNKYEKDQEKMNCITAVWGEASYFTDQLVLYCGDIRAIK